MENDKIPAGVYSRIEDAGILFDNKRYDGALLMLLVAVAATSRKRYPKLKDGQAFKTFLKDEMWLLVKGHSDTVEYHGNVIQIEEFLYRYLRCNLIHVGVIPKDLCPCREEDVITFSLPDGSKIGWGKILLTRLNDLLWKVSENSYASTMIEMGEAGLPSEIKS